MRSQYVMVVVLLAGLCGFAQQQPANPQSANPQSKDQQSTQTAPQPNAKQQTPAQGNPFPEAQSQKAQDAANGSAPAAKPGVSSSHVDLNRLNAPEGNASRISNGAGGYIHDPELAKQDDKVGAFYFQTGDYKGAYDRYLEATRIAPEDGNAVFGLAESARGLHLKKEAITNYLVYLDAFPDGKKAKDARKALAELGSPQKK